MKFSVEVDCTPEEARRFLGLPDVKPLQDAVVEEMNRRAMAAVQAMDPQALLRLWVPTGWQGIEEFQKLLLGQFAANWSGSRTQKTETDR